MKSSRALLIAGILGLSGVALGAFGAHALRAQLSELGTRDRWETAVHYHLLHAVAIFAAAKWLEVGAGASAANSATSSGRTTKRVMPSSRGGREGTPYCRRWFVRAEWLGWRWRDAYT